MRRLLVASVFVCAHGLSAQATDYCVKSREYLSGSMAGELSMPLAAYDDAMKTCLATNAMPNVKDTYLLKDGGIAVTPKQDTIFATAATLSQFCERYPRATLRFLSKQDIRMNPSVLDVVRLSSTTATSCKKLKGLD